MNKLYIIAAIAILFIGLSSCEEDEGKLPNISFKTGGMYISTNDTVMRGDTITVGINASKAEDKDILKTFDASKSLDGGTFTSFYTEALSGSSEDNYSKDLDIIIRNQAGTEEYSFTVVNRDGLKNTINLKLPVK